MRSVSGGSSPLPPGAGPPPAPKPAAACSGASSGGCRPVPPCRGVVAGGRRHAPRACRGSCCCCCGCCAGCSWCCRPCCKRAATPCCCGRHALQQGVGCAMRALGVRRLGSKRQAPLLSQRSTNGVPLCPLPVSDSEWRPLDSRRPLLAQCWREPTENGWAGSRKPAATARGRCDQECRTERPGPALSVRHGRGHHFLLIPATAAAQQRGLPHENAKKVSGQFDDVKILCRSVVAL